MVDLENYRDVLFLHALSWFFVGDELMFWVPGTSTALP
jgi:hypothetical protein